MIRRLSLPYHYLRNIIDYPLRQLFHWRHKGLRIQNESKKDLYAYLPESSRIQTQATASRLLQEYHLNGLYSCSSQNNYRENLYYLAMLESALAAADLALPDRIVAADIGPSHWFYVQALYAALKWWREPTGREVTLTGFEGDAYRIYADFYSRFDHAVSHMNGLPGVEFKPEAFKIQPAAFDVITMFFPFIFLPDHLEWGLPSSLFNPSTLLADAWRSVKPGGLLIIVNQGKPEQQAQQALLEGASIPIKASFPFDSSLYDYDIQRFITLACREHNSHFSG